MKWVNGGCKAWRRNSRSRGNRGTWAPNDQASTVERRSAARRRKESNRNSLTRARMCPGRRWEVNGWELCRVRTENGTSVAVQKSSNLYVCIYIYIYDIIWYTYDFTYQSGEFQFANGCFTGKMLKLALLAVPWCLELSPGAIPLTA